MKDLHIDKTHWKKWLASRHMKVDANALLQKM